MLHRTAVRNCGTAVRPFLTREPLPALAKLSYREQSMVYCALGYTALREWPAIGAMAYGVPRPDLVVNSTSVRNARRRLLPWRAILHQLANDVRQYLRLVHAGGPPDSLDDAQSPCSVIARNPRRTACDFELE